jgi:hypothetical protein
MRLIVSVLIVAQVAGLLAAVVDMNWDAYKSQFGKRYAADGEDSMRCAHKLTLTKSSAYF